MDEPTLKLNKRVDELAQVYSRRLGAIGDYAQFDEITQLDIAREDLQLVSNCLQHGDSSPFVLAVENRALERFRQGFSLDALLGAVEALEETLSPLVTSIDAAKFLWGMFSKARSTLSRVMEQAFRMNEETFETIFNASPVMFWLKDTENLTLRINQAAAEFEGVNPDDIAGKSCYDLYPQEQAEAFYQDDLAVIRSGKPRLGIIEKHTAVASGELMWVETGKVPTRDADGNITGVLAFAIDITERKQAEEQRRALVEAHTAELVASEARFRQLFEGSADAYLVLEENIFIDCNQATVEMLHASTKEEVLSTHPSHLSPERQPDGRFSAEKADEMIQIAIERGSHRFEWMHRRMDGKDILVEVLLTPIHVGGKQIVFTVWRDITERKRSEEELHRLRMALEQTADGIAITDLNDNLIFANSAWAEMHGYGVDEIQGAHLSIFHTAQQLRQEVIPFNQQAMEVGFQRGEVGHVRRDGRTFTTMMSSTLLRDDEGNTIGIVGSARDITEQRQAEQALRDSEQRFREFYESVRDGIAYVDITGRVLDANDIFQEMVGYSLEELRRMNFNDLKPLKWHAVEAEILEKQVLPQGFAIYEEEYLHKDGRTFPIELAMYLTRDENGDPTGFWGFIRDITRRKRLEQQVQEALERRGYQVQVSTQIAQEIAEAPALDELFRRVVKLVKDQFGYYHTQLLRYEPELDAVVLVAGYGETGQKMLEQGHRMPMGAGLVGTAAAKGKTMLRPDLTGDSDWQPNPLLPETKGEIAVPIKLRDEVLGVLDVQSDDAGALNEDDRLLLEGLCGQIAIAIQSTRLVQELSTSQERFDLAVQGSNDGIWDWDIVKNEVYYSPRLKEMVGYADHEFGNNFAEFESRLHPEDHDRVMETVSDYLEGRIPVYDVEFRFGHKDGSYRWMRARGTVIRDEAGTPVRMAGSHTDITERKQAENQLDSQHRTLQAVLENMPAGVVVAETPTGAPLLANQAAVEMLGRGISPEAGEVELAEMYQAYRYGTDELYPPEQMPLVRGMLGESTSVDDMEVRYPDGKRGQLQVFGAPIRDADGNITSSVAIFQDITERKVAESQLSQALEQAEIFRRFADAAGQALSIATLNGNIIYANRVLARMLGVETPEELYGRNLVSFYPKGLVQRLQEQALPTVMTKEEWTGEISLTASEGRVTPAIQNIFLIRDYGGNPMYLANVIVDISERKQAEEELTSSRERFDLAVQGSNDGIWDWDIVKNEVYYSPRLKEMVGYADHEFGNNFAEFESRLHPEDHDRVMGTVSDYLEGRIPVYDVEFRFRHKDGSYRWMRARGTAIRDEAGTPVRMAGSHTDVTENKRTEALMEERLNELNSLYRATSREGWEAFRASVQESNAYLYDRIAVKPEDNLWSPEIQAAVQQGKITSTLVEHPEEDGGQAAIATPIAVRGEIIGALGVYDDPQNPLSEDDLALIDQVSDQVAQALEGARLFEQTQTALAEAQALYTGSARVIAASTTEEVLNTLVEVTPLSKLDRVYLYFFDKPWDVNVPDAMVQIAGWQKGGGESVEPVGTSYDLADYQILSQHLSADQPLVVKDVRSDQRVDENSRVVLDELGTRSLIFLPLRAGGVWYGVLDGEYSQVMQLSPDEIRQVRILADQAATVIQSLRLQEDMSERVRELTSLQRMMSREAWAAYKAQAGIESQGYLFDRVSVKPLSSENISGDGSDGKKEQAMAAVTMALQDAFIARLAVRGEPIGVLGVREEAGRRLTPEDEAFLQAISEQVAQAMERARLIEQTQKAAVELQAVADVSTATSTILNPEELLQSVVDLAKGNFGLYHAHVYLLDEAEENLTLAVGAGEIGREMASEGWSIPLEEVDSLVASVARSRNGQIISDIRQQEGHLANPLLPDTLSELAVPMVVGDNLLGVFDVQSDVADVFTEEDVMVYGTLAAQVAVALQNAELYAEQLETVERLRELDNMKSAFLANMSHELRTPLNSILGFTQVILEELDGPLTDLMISDLELIEKNGKHLLNLINDVLDMAKIEAGRLTLSPEPLNLYELFDEVIVTNSPMARDKNLYMVLDADYEDDWTVMADHVRMRQILINLVGNSLKFTDSGGITVELERLLAQSEDEHDRIQARIIDTGIGIPSDRLEDIFEAFSQVDSSTTRKAGGTGLGLPISRRLVELHGGRLWAKSRGISGEGSTLFLELPVGRQLGSIVE